MKKFLATAAVLALFAVPALAEEKKPAAEAPKPVATCCEKGCKGGEKCHAGKKECGKDCKEECCKKAEAPKKS